MTVEETKMVGEWMKQWSDEKMEMLYLKDRIADLEKSLDHASKTANETSLNDLKELNRLTDERNSARKKLFNCIILMNEIYKHLSSHGRMSTKCSKTLMDKLMNLQKENDITVIGGGMAK